MIEKLVPNHQSIFMINPTTGEWIVKPEHKARVVRAIMREVGRMKRRLYFTRARLYMELLLFRARLWLLRHRHTR